MTEAGPGRDDRRADRVRGPRHGRRRDPGAGPERRRLLHAARGLLAARARDLRRVQRAADLRRGDLRVGSARRVVRRQRYDYLPDIITTAKGLTSAYAPMGAVIVSDRVAEPFMHGHQQLHPRVHVRRAPDLRGGRAGQPRRVRARGRARERARQRGRVPRRCSSRCATSRSSATSAAPATSTRSSWSRTRTPKAVVRRRGVRDAAARLPVRRALPPRADLPRRRPRRPGDPAVAAADRRSRAVRGDRGDPAAGARPRPASACTSHGHELVDAADRRGASSPELNAPMLTVRELLRDLDVRLLAGEAASTCRSAGCTSPSCSIRRRGCRAASCC